MVQDIERKGSISHRRRSSRDVYPVPTNEVPVFIPTPEKRRTSFVVPFIVVVNVIMFIITMYVNNCPKHTSDGKCIAKFLGRFSFQPVSENPLIGPSASTLQKLGALVTDEVEHKKQGWRLVSCIWLHAGVAHVAANMISLLFIGIRLEQEFGFVKIGILYLLSGVGGSLLSALFLESRISVGASGAVFGLLGATLSELIINWSIYANKCAALISLVLIVAVNLAVGILPYVDNFAHIGGFLTGFLLGFVLLLRPQFGWVNRAYIPAGYEVDSPSKKHKFYQYILFSISLIIVIVGFVVLLVLVFKGVDANKQCSWCHYLNCVPSSKWSCNTNATCNVETTDATSVIKCLTNNNTMTTSANQTDSDLNSLCVKLCS